VEAGERLILQNVQVALRRLPRNGFTCPGNQVVPV
jgi:hypothetical protein